MRRPATAPARPVAPALVALLEDVLGAPPPARVVAWDGSSAGPDLGAPTVTLHSPGALQRLVRHPGELGAAQAYVTGELSIDWPVERALRHVRGQIRQCPARRIRLSPKVIREAVGLLRGADAFGRPPAPPATQIAVTGRLHSRRRDAAVIHHHYDIPTDFYELILDDAMAYSCGYVTGASLDAHETPAYTLEDAQRDKLDLVCRKLGLDQRPGMRLLDVGCGWGALSLHAAEHYDAAVTGVTIAREQQQFVEKRAADRGLTDRVTIRLQDYRDVADRRYDAVASLEMGEHAGDRGYPAFVETLRRNAAPHARILVQQMSRRGAHPGGGPFIEAFIAPDMTMRPVGETVELLERGGLEVRDVHALREHYAWTVRAWQDRFVAAREELTRLVGEEVVRVWELYLAGGLLAFEEGRMGVDQILAVPAPGAPTTVPAVRPATWSDPRG
ncbi:SAM-dependent methyltransferase [Barrientosiimonas endolithica]|uniref:Cyclopropane-fatty-acyl-phospholipid synthase n=1 Tax=Barrientosiimonas endolithica TaxID=1535208 RepID=A0ABN6YR94_9MICO|nr:cyclopropane-fatty-acyl-phospholipid synthase family protein [Barrientosiimonas endolithica]BDZ59887.1 cyclopropane-fatty-acyl-phospholipid synthase [Barrientosiimonas endolithica]